MNKRYAPANLYLVLPDFVMPIIDYNTTKGYISKA